MKKKNKTSFELQFKKQPDDFIYLNEFFSVYLHCIDKNTNKIITCPKSIKITSIKLYNSTEDLYNANTSYELANTNSLYIAKGQTDHLTLRLSINRLSKNDNYQIEITYDNNQNKVLSNEFKVIRYKLYINQQPANIWYRDGPGNNNLSCDLKLVQKIDENPLEMINCNLYLKHELYYTNEKCTIKAKKVEDDFNWLELCKTTHNMFNSLHKNNIFQYKIKQISSKYFKRKFIIKISIDKIELLSSDVIIDPLDIAYVYTDPIEVKSKRVIKRKRNINTTSIKQDKAIKKKPSSTLYNTLKEQEQSNGNGNNQATKQSIASSSSLSPQASYNSNTTSTASPSDYDLIDLISNNNMISNIAQQHFTKDDLYTLRNIRPYGRALSEMIGFCEYAYNSLQSMNFQHVGFTCTEDGNLDLNSPIYRCPSCWTYKDNLRTGRHSSNCKLNNTIQIYENILLEHIQLLINHTLHDHHRSHLSSSTSHAIDNDPPVLRQLKSLSETMPPQLLQQPSTEHYINDKHDITAAAYLVETDVQYIYLHRTQSGFPAYDEHYQFLGTYNFDSNDEVLIFSLPNDTLSATVQHKLENEFKKIVHDIQKKHLYFVKEQSLKILKQNVLNYLQTI